MERQSVVLAPLCVSGPASSDEIAEHLKAMLDQLRWFYERGMKVTVAPAASGWTLYFKEGQ